MVVSDMYQTFVKLDTIDTEKTLHTGLDGFDSYGKLDRCCSKQEFNGKTVEKLNKWYPRANDIKRVPCTISKEKFEAEYVRKNRPVILTGCSTDWTAQAKWSMEYLLGMDNGNKEWLTNYIVDSAEVGDQTLIKRETKGKDVLDIRASNRPFKILDSLKTGRSNGDAILPTDKMELLEDYEAPQGIPENLLSKCGILTNNEWIELGTPNTG